MQFAGAGLRVFDVMVGECMVIRKLDIYTKVGYFSALQEYVALR
jgi:hypothetical protein